MGLELMVVSRWGSGISQRSPQRRSGISDGSEDINFISINSQAADSLTANTPTKQWTASRR